MAESIQLPIMDGDRAGGQDDQVDFDNPLELSEIHNFGAKLRQQGQVEERLSALEGAVHGQKMLAEPVFDTELEALEFSDDSEVVDD